MWTSIRKRLRREKSSKTRASRSQTCPARAPCTIIEAFTCSGPVHDQFQSPLFSKLSTELRLAIYEAALADPIRLLHILPVRGGGTGNWRCKDIESPFPIWQHSCYGRWFCESEGRVVRRLETRSNGNLLPLLLTCRRIYSEAIDVLYTTNEFSFRGAAGVLRFESILPASHWHKLRRVHVSTVFLTPMRRDPNHNVIPPENYARWQKACSALSELEHLYLLSVDFTIWSLDDYKGNNTIEEDALLFIFNCLGSIRATRIQVELNVELPELVRALATSTKMKIKRFERPYSKIFGRF